MLVQLNHTIVWSANRTKSARFLAALLGLPEPARFWHFDVVQFGNGVGLDFADAEGPIPSQHFAFLVSEADFDAIFKRIVEQDGFTPNSRPSVQDQATAHRADPSPIARSLKYVRQGRPV